MKNPIVIMSVLTGIACAEPIRLHPKNPRYFEWNGKAVALVTSAEHYGAVLNKGFDFRKYLATLQKDGLNYTRIFSGVYRERQHAFGIEHNTLAPQDEDYLSPFEREKSGKFRADRWNEAFFVRLKEFISEAAKRGIIVEVTLFCPFYENEMWDASPLNPRNNNSGMPDMPRTDAMTMKHPAMVKLHGEIVRKFASELYGFDNFFFEICNEPYFGGVTLAWQAHISQTIADAEAALGARRHLIAQNIANNTATIHKPDPRVSIFNFHYARPPQAIDTNVLIQKVFGYDETGFDGADDATYRMQAWDFIMAGGALYNNLDYSFAVGHEDGTKVVSVTEPGGGSPRLRRQIGFLNKTVNALPLESMASVQVDDARILSGGGALLLYRHHGELMKDSRPAWLITTGEQQARLEVSLGAGDWSVRYWDPKTGKLEREDHLSHHGGNAIFNTPRYREDILIEVRQK
jgi:hypothetical protein